MSIKKLVIGLAVVAMALTMVSTASAQALTADQILAALTANPALLAQLQALLGGGSSMNSSHTFSTDLTVGNKGDDVTALQHLLVDGGYLASGLPFGYFGPLTKAALIKWQIANGVSPAVGYFGPISRGIVNGMTPSGPTPPVGGVFPAGCTNSSGFSTTTGQPCSPAASTIPGCTSTAGYSPTTGQPCSAATNAGGTVADGTDGSVIVSYNGYAPASQTLQKGNTNKPVLAFKLQATNGKVAVSHVDIDFNGRPWLLFSKVTLKDAAGTVIGTKTLSGPNDSTEVTVGSDYKIRINGLNYIVTPGTDAIIHADVDVLAASDKITGQTVTVWLPSDAIRTVNGIGFGQTVGLSSGQGSSATPNSIILSSSGSIGDIYSSISPSSSATKRTVVTNSSTSSITPGVTLGVFRLKSQNQAATINGLSFNFNTDGNGADAANLYQNVRLEGPGGLIYGMSGSVATTSTATANIFTNMLIPLIQDQWTDLTLKADILGGVTGTASTTLRGLATYIVGTDVNYNTLTAASAASVTAADIVFSTSGLQVSNPVATLGVCSAQYSQGLNDHCAISFSFTLTNVGNSDLYISRTPGIVVATSSTPSTASTTIQTFTPPTALSGDNVSSLSYVIPTGGTPRTFTLTGTMSKKGGTAASQTFQITNIYFGTVATLDGPKGGAASNATQNISYGLEPLFIQTVL